MYHFDFLTSQNHIILPVLMLVICASLIILTLIRKPTDSALSLATIALGTPFFIVGVSWKNKPSYIQTKISKFYYVG